MPKRRLVDCQYFPFKDIVVINEVIEGIGRNYTIIKNPDFYYYVEPELKTNKKFTSYYKNVNELNKVECKYKNRHSSIAKSLGMQFVNDNTIDLNYELKSKIMLNHNIYSGDDSIEFRVIMDYLNKYKDDIDNTIPIKYMFFDIEVHSDFNKHVYSELVNIYKSISKNKEYEPNLENINLDKYDFIMNETDPKIISDHIKEYTHNKDKNAYIDYKFLVALMNSKFYKEIDKERVIKYIKTQVNKDVLKFIHENIGFPDESKALNRVDAISFVDSVERKLYMYLLDTKTDLNEDLTTYINNTNLVTEDLYNFVELFYLVSYLTNIDKSEKENCKELLDNLDYLSNVYKGIEINNEDKEKISYFITLAKEKINDYDKKIKIDIEYKCFKEEKTMILDFFNMIKNIIKPNIIAAHNAKFDILTLKNRLELLGENFNSLINQLDIVDNDLSNIDSDIKIDLLTMERKKDKTRYTIPGLVCLDTLLLYAKLSSKEKNWSLDAIVKEELNDSKIPYQYEIFEFYHKDIKRFIKYSSIDTLLLLRLEEKLKFLDLYQIILFNSRSPWSVYMHKSKTITNLIKYELTNRKDGVFVCRNNLTGLNPKKEKVVGTDTSVGYRGAYNTDTARVKTNGLYQNVFDLDFASFYPNCAITTNLCITNTKFTTPEEEKHNDYMFMSRIGFGNKYLNLPKVDDIIKDL